MLSRNDHVQIRGQKVVRTRYVLVSWLQDKYRADNKSYVSDDTNDCVFCSF